MRYFRSRNSSAGSVRENYDLLVEYDHCIVGEQIVKIEHVLLGLPEAELQISIGSIPIHRR